MTSRTLTADRGDAGQRLDLVVRRHLSDIPSASRTRVQAWISRGDVTVNGVPVVRASARIAFGDVVTVRVAAARSTMAAEPADLDILHEDDHLLVVNKPAGLVVHPSYRHAGGTLMNALLWHARTWAVGSRPSLVGRLDKLTSGIVLVAKHRRAHAALQRATLAEGSHKDYLALVYGRVNVARGTIDFPLGRDVRDRRKVVALPGGAKSGVASVTRFERLDRLASPAPPLSLLRCRLVTGRMHQIRVHLAARGWPLVGDPTYGDPPWSRIHDASMLEALRAFPRQALHAWRTSFTHPLTMEALGIEAPVPHDLAELLARTGLAVDRAAGKPDARGQASYAIGARKPRIR